MLLPGGNDYEMMVQAPHVAFADPDLKVGNVELDPQGIPKAYSGGFAVTYKFTDNQQKKWAVRCFVKGIEHLAQRYQAISNFQQRHHSPYLLPAVYLETGIRVNGKPYPIIKMQWQEGDPINLYIYKHYNNSAMVTTLLTAFTKLIDEFDRYGIAHGDLQHGNIIVRNNQIFLVDYDGMYFPELSSLQSNEIGHLNYQHPKRDGSHYNQRIDRFSSIVIYIGLKAISMRPDLWKKYDNGENILFRSQDFANLQQSNLIADLMSIPSMKVLVERFIGCCYLDPDRVPTLKDFLTGNFDFNSHAAGTITINRSQYLVLNAADSERILAHKGEKIEVIGKVSAIRSSYTKMGNPYAFLNFGLYPRQTFTLVIWSEGLAALTLNGTAAENFVGKWVSVTGVVGSYIDKPQMNVELHSQIQLLSGEGEAKQRLSLRPGNNQNSSGAAHPKTTGTTATAQASPGLQGQTIFGTTYTSKQAPDPAPAAVSTATSNNVHKPAAPTQPSAAKPSTHSQSTYQFPVPQSKSNDELSGCIVGVVIGLIAGATGYALTEHPAGFWIAFLGVMFLTYKIIK